MGRSQHRLVLTPTPTDQQADRTAKHQPEKSKRHSCQPVVLQIWVRQMTKHRNERLHVCALLNMELQQNKYIKKAKLCILSSLILAGTFLFYLISSIILPFIYRFVGFSISGVLGYISGQSTQRFNWCFIVQICFAILHEKRLWNNTLRWGCCSVNVPKCNKEQFCFFK